MKNSIIAFVGIAACLTACATEQPALDPVITSSAPKTGSLTGKLNVSHLGKLSKIGLSSRLNVSLYSLDGTRVERTAALQPNTDYRLTITGAENLLIRACFGFTLLDKNEQPSQTGHFFIKTDNDVLESPIVSVIPLRHIGSSVFREQAQTIALTK